jgi:hypothetical protein
MKKNVIKPCLSMLLVVFVFFTSCELSKSKISEKKHFSGVIEYDIEFEEINPENEMMWFHRQYYGNKMKLTITQNSDYLKEHFNAGEYGMDYQFYDASKNIFYAKSNFSDTLTAFLYSKKDMVTIKEEVEIEEETILGNVCQGILFESKVDSSLTFFSNETIKSSFYFTNNYQINPKVHRGINNVTWQRFLAVGNGAYYLKYISEETNHKVTYTATKITRKDIPAINFKPFLKDLPIEYLD